MNAIPKFVVTPVAAIALASNDVLSAFFSWYLDLAENLSPSLFWTLVRLAFLLILTTILCAVSFKRLRDTIPHGSLMTLQWLLALLAAMLVMQLPLPSIPLTRPCKGWILAPSIFALLVLPWRLSFLLVPTEGPRRITAFSMYAAMALLLIIQLFR